MSQFLGKVDHLGVDHVLMLAYPGQTDRWLDLSSLYQLTGLTICRCNSVPLVGCFHSSNLKLVSPK